MKKLRAVAQLRINGTEAPFTLDSGAFFSSMTDAAAAQLNLKSRLTALRAWGITGRVDYRVTRVERLGLQSAEIKDVEFLVGGNEPGAGTMGLLGRNVLSMNDTEYDLANGVVRLMRPSADCAGSKLAYWAGATPVVEVPLIAGWGEKIPAIKAEARINGKSVTVLFDTGAVSILSLDAAKRLGLVDDKTRMRPAGTVFGVGKGERPSWTVPVESFQLGAESIKNARLRVADMVDLDDVDMLLGIDFFLSHRIYVAPSQNRMFITYSGGPVFDMSQKTTTPVKTDVDDTNASLDASALSRRGTALATRGEPMRALDDLNRAVELAPTAAAYRAQRARVRLEVRQRDAALLDLEEALRLDPKADEVRLDRAWLRMAVHADGAEDAARADLAVLDDQLAPQSDIRRKMGDLFMVLNEPLLAARQYDQWLSAHPSQADLYVALNKRCWARALANTELDKALNDCNEALDAKPKAPAYLDSRGLVYLRLGQWKKAIADYDAALALNPKKKRWSLWGRGLAYIRAGDRYRGLIDIAAAKSVDSRIEADARRYGLDVPADSASEP